MHTSRSASIITEIAAGAGASVQLDYQRGAPPVVNDPDLAATMRAAIATVRDLHQGKFDIDERAIGIGVRMLVSTALVAFAG